MTSADEIEKSGMPTGTSAVQETLFKRLQRWQKIFKTKVLDNPKFKWYQRGVWIISLGYALFLAIESVPYYTAIGAGENLFKAGDYRAAEKQFDTALKESQKFSPTDLRRAKVLNNLAELYRAEGRYQDALQKYKEAVQIARTLPKNRPELALSLHNLGNLYRDMGRYSDSESTYKEALSTWDTNIKKDDLNRAAILNGIGKLKRDEGKYAEAEKTYKDALALKEKLLGANDAELAVVLDNLGGVYRDQGKYKESEAYYKKALAIDEAALGPKHPYVGTDVNNLAGLYRDEKRYAEATPLYERALSIRKAALGDLHPLLAKTYSGMAELASAQGDYHKASLLLTYAKDIQSTAFQSSFHPELATTYDLLGNVYMHQNNLSGAKWAFDRCIEMREGVLDHSHPDLGIAYIDRARCEHLLKDEPAARKDFEHGKDILTKSLGTDHPTTKRMLSYQI